MTTNNNNNASVSTSLEKHSTNYARRGGYARADGKVVRQVVLGTEAPHPSGVQSKAPVGILSDEVPRIG